MALDLGFLDAAPGAMLGAPLILNVGVIDEDPNNPRTHFTDLDGFAENIKERGILQPIVVRPPVEGRYMIRFGARRFRSAKLAGLTEIPVVISADPRQLDDYAQVSENRQRSELTPLEEAAFIKKRLDAGDKRKDIAIGMQVSASTITTLSALIDPPAFLLELYHSGKCTTPEYLYRLRSLHSTKPERVIEKIRAAPEITRRFIEELATDLNDVVKPPKPATEPPGALREPKLDERAVTRHVVAPKARYDVVMVKHKDRTAQLILDRRAQTVGVGWIRYQDNDQEIEAVLTECTLNALLES